MLMLETLAPLVLDVRARLESSIRVRWTLGMCPFRRTVNPSSQRFSYNDETLHTPMISLHP